MFLSFANIKNTLMPCCRVFS